MILGKSPLKDRFRKKKRWNPPQKKVDSGKKRQNYLEAGFRKLDAIMTRSLKNVIKNQFLCISTLKKQQDFKIFLKRIKFQKIVQAHDDINKILY